MNTYLVLQNPGHNRVYYKTSTKLALSELTIAASRLSSPSSNIGIREIAGIRYLQFDLESKLSKTDLDIVSRLSFFFALYKLEQQYLLPIQRICYEYLDDKISSILKYSGKTNELFTRMMINVALLSSDYNYNQKINLLDPVAGRGTTLFEGLISGFSGTGVEADSKAVHDSEIFFKKYLEEEKLKHSLDKRQIGQGKKNENAYGQKFLFAKDKTDFKDKSKQLNVEFIHGQTQHISDYFKKDSFHLIVGDLPYGIAHGNKGKTGKGKSNTRNPSELLEAALPGWFKVLKNGGVVVISWNSFLIARDKLAEIFNRHGFSSLTEETYFDFEHLVDRSIKRDIIVAKKIKTQN